MRSRLRSVLLFGLLGWMATPGFGCELCAIYGASGVRGESGSGFLFTVAEQYISALTLQGEGEPFSAIPFLSDAYLDTLFTHLVPGYNFSSRVGLSLNAPILYRDFRRTQLLTTGGAVADTGSITGLCDVALIGILHLFHKMTMMRSSNV